MLMAGKSDVDAEAALRRPCDGYLARNDKEQGGDP